MDVLRNGPADLAEQRVRWLDGRQRVLANNIANADTPGFRPSDVTPFRQALATARAPMALTDARHMPPSAERGGMRAVVDRSAVERTPNGNAVSLDIEAARVAETDQAHALAMGLRRKYLDLFRNALGRP